MSMAVSKALELPAKKKQKLKGIRSSVKRIKKKQKFGVSFVLGWWVYLIGSTAEPSVPNRATMPEKVLDIKQGGVFFLLILMMIFLSLMIMSLAKVGDYCFLCLLLSQHCPRFFSQKATSKSW